MEILEINKLASILISYDMLIHGRNKAFETRVRKNISNTLLKLHTIEEQVIEMKIPDDIVESYIFLMRIVDHLDMKNYAENEFCIHPPATKSGKPARNCTSSTGLLYIYLSHFTRYKINICFVGTHIFIGFGPTHMTKSPLQLEFADTKMVGVVSGSAIRAITRAVPSATTHVHKVEMQCGSQRQPLKQLLILLNALTQWVIFQHVDDAAHANFAYLQYFNFILSHLSPNSADVPTFTSIDADIHANTFRGITHDNVVIDGVPEYIIKKLGIRASRIDLPGMFYYTQEIDGMKLREWTPAPPSTPTRVPTFSPPHTPTPTTKKRIMST